MEPPAVTAPVGDDSAAHASSAPETAAPAASEEPSPINTLEEETPLFAVDVLLPEGTTVVRFEGIPIGSDAAASVRQMLAEHPQTCSLTAYRLELECGAPAAPRVCVPFTDLTDSVAMADALLAEGARNIVRVACENYTVRSARAHVRRFREVLQRPPVQPHRLQLPTAPLQEQQPAGEDDSAEGVVAAAAAAPAAPTAAANGTEVAATGATDPELVGMKLLLFLQAEREEIAHAQTALVLPALPLPVDLSLLFPVPVPTDPEDAEGWMGAAAAAAAAAETAKQPRAGAAKHAGARKGAGGGSSGGSSGGSGKKSEGGGAIGTPISALSSPAGAAAAEAHQPLIQCLRSVTLSGWNPPPAPVSRHFFLCDVMR